MNVKPAMHNGRPYTGPPVSVVMSLAVCDAHRETLTVSDLIKAGMWDVVIKQMRAMRLATPSKECTTISFKVIGDMKHLGGMFAEQ